MWDGSHRLDLRRNGLLFFLSSGAICRDTVIETFNEEKYYSASGIYVSTFVHTDRLVS